MAMIYRRNPHGGGRLTTTIPLNDALRQSQLQDAHSDDKDDTDDTHDDEDGDGEDDSLPASSPASSAASSPSSASATASSRPRRLLVRGLQCLRGRKPKTKTPTGSALNLSLTVSNSEGLSHRVSQILWLALLVYAFFGLPVLGRILNFCRYFHRFTGVSIVTGLVVGFCQDVAIFVQASTVIVLIKALFQPVSLQRRLSANHAASSSATFGSASSTSSLNVGGASFFSGGASTSMAATLAQERYPHSAYGGARYVHLPVYVPVRTNEYEAHGPSSSTTESDAIDATLPIQAPYGAKHLTLVASSSSTDTAFPWSLSSSTTSVTPMAMALGKLRHLCVSVLVLLLVKVVLILATVASVADFCLQVTMHPRLNRAFVEIFVNYMAQFTASLTDEEVLTPAVVFAWTTYLMLVATMTFGFYTERLPFLPDVLSWSSSSSSSSSSTSWFNSIWCCCLAPIKRLFIACHSIVKRRRSYYRKDSSLPPPSSSSHDVESGRSVQGATGFFKSWLSRKQSRRKDSDIIILNDNPMSISAPSAVNARSNFQRRRRNSSSGHAHGTFNFSGGSFSNGFGLFSGSTAYGGSSQSALWMKPKTPLGIVLHCIVVSVFVTLGALCASLIVHTSTGTMSGAGKHHGFMVGVDVQLMANPMFALQTENFFTRKNRIGADHINCTAASHKLLQTLGKSEVYETEGMGNDDSCALLWRKTTAYQGETLWDINWNVTVDEGEGSPTPVNADAEATTLEPAEAANRNTSNKLAPRPPNIIVINMESWRYLDVGVLGGATKKAKYGKSATPHFDRLSKEGVLYRKHYTQCVQTTRTLLTQLFGMLPSCTETTALKMYGTGLTVRGLPQYLKSRGYFNMFWSAVDLSWEYWDKFLMMNGFDKLVDEKKIRKMLHETKNYDDRADDHFSWGMHDHLSFDMLLYALEAAKNSTLSPASTVETLGTEKNRTDTNGNATRADVSAVESELKRGENATTEGAEAPAPLPPAFTSQHDDRESNGQTQIRGRVGSPDDKKGKSQVAGPASVGPGVGSKDTLNVKRRIRPIAGWEGLQEPYFIDMYTITSHNPWALPTDYVVPDLTELYTRFNKRYVDSMYFSDDMLGQFVDSMRAKGLMKNTVVIVQGDHGYGRLEHDNNPSIADSALYDEATHVPFLILADDFLAEHEKGTQVNQLTMQSDLMATIADIVGVSEEDPLLQHGYGHSMRRKHSRKAKVKDVDFGLIHARTDPEEEDERDHERRVLLCNPFNGATKGTRTEDLKYVFNPDGSFKVFELATDPAEKRPIESGYDYEEMSETTKAMREYVTEHVDLNQFLFETNKFTTKIPLPAATARARHIKEQKPSRAVAEDEVPRDAVRSVTNGVEPEVIGYVPASPVEDATSPEPQPVEEMEREVATPSARAPE